MAFSMDIYELAAQLRKLKISTTAPIQSPPAFFAIMGWFRKSIKVIAPAWETSIVFGDTRTTTATVGYISLKENKIYVKYAWIDGSHAFMENIAQWIVENTDLVRGN
jgi:hypothetical protein